MKIPSLDDNLRDRLEFTQNCECDEEKRAQAIRLFKDDIVSFFNFCLWTYDPRQTASNRPFQLWEYQDKYVRKVNQHIIDGKSLLTEKSRDMGVTWMILGVFLYRWLLFDENYLIGSRKEELVDKRGDITSLFERLRYMMRTLPVWLRQQCSIDTRNDSHMKICKPNGASLVGESMNIHFSRQGRHNAILLDEFAFVDGADSIWTACGDTSPCKLPISTPRGSHNKFARIRKSGLIDVETLHWKVHPHKDEAWYRGQQKGRTDKEIAQELDINYTISAGSPFYVGFSRSIHLRKLQAIRDTLILGWDYGFHHPSCVISQIDSMGRWVILDCLFGSQEQIWEFGEKVKTHLNINYPGLKTESYGDPAGNQINDKSSKTSVQFLAEIGFNVVSTASNTYRTNPNARKAIIELKLKTLIGDMPALIVNDIPSTQIIVEGFEGGLHYAEANRHGFVPDKAVRDGYYEHPMDAMSYIAANVFSATREAEQIVSSGATVRTGGNLGDFHIEYEDEHQYSPAFRKAMGLARDDE